MDDAETAWVMNVARKIGVTIHVRGTDAHPVVELRDRRSRQVVGGIEFKRRLQLISEKGQ